MSHRIFVISVLLCLISFGSLSGQGEQKTTQYLWPTNASRYLTSAFGEYRPRRFHMGLDIKTWGKIGYECFAVRPGYVWRVSVSPYGYGKSLYVRLDTGETAIYAHLSRFSKRIQALVEKEQQRTGRYRINLFLKSDMIPVHQGEVIGYSGQTGIGAPHLHFEIRDAANHPTNPLLKGYELPDKVNPIVRAVSFSPLDADSEVNGDYRPCIVAARWVGKGEYVLKEPVTFWGNVGLAVKAHDMSNVVPHRFGVYSLKLYVDDNLRFEYRYDRLGFETNFMVELERDYRQYRRGQGRFYKLYKDRFNAKTYYHPNREWAGVLTSASLTALPLISGDATSTNTATANMPEAGALFPGEHDFSIEVADFFGNISRVSGNLRVGAAFDLAPIVSKNDSGSLEIDNLVTFDLNRLQQVEAFTLKGAHWQQLPVDWRDVLLGQTEKGGSESPDGPDELFSSPVSIPVESSGTVILKFQAQDQFGVDSYPAYYVRSTSAANTTPAAFDVAYDYYDDYLRLGLTSRTLLQGVPRVILYPESANPLEIPVHQTLLKRYLARIKLADLRGTHHDFLINAQRVNGERVAVMKEFGAEPVIPRQASKMTSSDGRFKVTFSKKSLYRPLYLKTIIDSSLSITNLPAVGYIYKVEPTDVLLKAGARVSLQYPESEKSPDKLGVYYHRRNKWVFIDNRHDSAARTISAKIMSFEEFVLVRDDVAPEITNMQPAHNSHIDNRSPLISVSVRDRLSGIGSERNLEIRLDGRRLIAEYDPERRRLFYKPRTSLTPGRHELIVSAQDRSGNSRVERSYFWIN